MYTHQKLHTEETALNLQQPADNEIVLENIGMRDLGTAMYTVDSTSLVHVSLVDLLEDGQLEQLELLSDSVSVKSFEVGCLSVITFNHDIV